MVSPVLNEARWSGEFLVSEANNSARASQVTLKQQTYVAPQVYSRQAARCSANTMSLDRRPIYAATGGNTGNFTCGAVAESGRDRSASTRVEFIAATVYNVYDPNGALVGEGKTGVAFAGGGLAFTITAGGTPAVAGDSGTITVAANADAGKYGPLDPAANGLQNAAAILFNTLDASAADTKATVIARAAEVNGSELTYPAAQRPTRLPRINAQLSVLGIRSARHNSQENLGSTSPLTPTLCPVGGEGVFLERKPSWSRSTFFTRIRSRRSSSPPPSRRSRIFRMALEAMGIFDDKPIRTKALMVEEREGKLTLIPMSDRGAPATERTNEKRKARYFEVPRMRHGDTIYADEIFAIREFGQETELMQVQKEIMRRTVGPTGLRSKCASRRNFTALAAVQGKLLDTDGSVKYRLVRGIRHHRQSRPSRSICWPTRRAPSARSAADRAQMKRKAQGAFIPENRTQVIALCGDQFYDNFVTHADVEKTYANWRRRKICARAPRSRHFLRRHRVGELPRLRRHAGDLAGFTNGSAAITGLPTGLANGNAISGPGIPTGATISSYNSGAGTANLSANFVGTTGTYS
jgi:hypothetical protein